MEGLSYREIQALCRQKGIVPLNSTKSKLIALLAAQTTSEEKNTLTPEQKDEKVSFPLNDLPGELISAEIVHHLDINGLFGLYNTNRRIRSLIRPETIQESRVTRLSDRELNLDLIRWSRLDWRIDLLIEVYPLVEPRVRSDTLRLMTSGLLECRSVYANVFKRLAKKLNIENVIDLKLTGHHMNILRSIVTAIKRRDYRSAQKQITPLRPGFSNGLTKRMGELLLLVLTEEEMLWTFDQTLNYLSSSMLDVLPKDRLASSMIHIINNCKSDSTIDAYLTHIQYGEAADDEIYLQILLGVQTRLERADGGYSEIQAALERLERKK